MKWSDKRKEEHSKKMKEKWAIKRLGDMSSGVVEGEERANEVQAEMGKDVQNVPPGMGQPHTITDIKFEGAKPGYYIFETHIVKAKDGSDRKCWYCGCAYESRLLLNKFCCPEHKERWLVASLRRGKE